MEYSDLSDFLRKRREAGKVRSHLRYQKRLTSSVPVFRNSMRS